MGTAGDYDSGFYDKSMQGIKGARRSMGTAGDYDSGSYDKSMQGIKGAECAMDKAGDYDSGIYDKSIKGIEGIMGSACQRSKASDYGKFPGGYMEGGMDKGCMGRRRMGSANHASSWQGSQGPYRGWMVNSISRYLRRSCKALQLVSIASDSS